MNPFDKVTLKLVKNEIEYTCAGTVVNVYTKNGDAMCTVSLLGSQDVVHVKQSECTKL